MALTTTISGGGSVTSFSNTPQAKGDLYNLSEDLVGYTLLDVMSNDLGGNAKTLYSIDDGIENEGSETSADLLTKDVVDTAQESLLGAKIWIHDGQVAYSIDGGTSAKAIDFQHTVQSLAVGETLTDSFTYAIRLGNGTLSWNTVQVVLTGTNDAPTITAVSTDATGSVTEDAATPKLSDTGTITFNDVDLTDTHITSVKADSGNTLGGTLTMGTVSESSSTESGTVGWTYEVANSATQYLADGESVTEKFTVTIDDQHGGTVDQIVEVTITGTNDAPDITGTQVSAGVSETNTTLTATGTLNVVDVDLSDTVTVTVDSVAVDSTSTFAGTNPLSDADLKEMMSVLPTTALDADPSAGTNFDWSFTSGSSGDKAFNFLGEGKTLVLNYTLKATDDSGAVNNNDTQVVTITITGTNDAPVITAPNGGDAVAQNVEENTTAVADVNATDVDGDAITYSLIGDDAALFNIDTNGVVTFKVAPNYESPGDAGGDNVYNFTAVASDGSLSDTQNFAVTVTDVVEGPIVASPYTGTGDPNDFDSLVGSSSPGYLVVNGTTNADEITGDTSANNKDIINGYGGDDIINAGDATDQVYGGDGDDKINGGTHSDSLYGQAGIDTIHGDEHGDTIYGGSGNDFLYGDANDDIIYGGSGTDTIYGGEGNDTIVGGYGADNLDGGSGADTFKYLSVLDTGDVITGFSSADDTLDFSGIDANSATGANDAFASATNATTVAAHSINYFQDGANTTVWADTDGNTATVEFQVTLTGVTASLLASSDFVL